MTRSAYSFGSKALVILTLLLCTHATIAQRNKAPDYFQSFLNTQFWLGLRFGINYTNPIPSESFTTFHSLDDIDEVYEKTYNSFDKPGGQAGLHISLYHKGFSFEVLPTFKIERYSYFSELSWTGNDVTDDFETRYDLTQTLNVIEIPLVLKYDILRSGEIRPFVQAGLQYSMIIDARKNAKVTHTEFSTGEARDFNGGEFSLGVRESFKNFYGAVGGVGASFDFSNVRTIVEFSYLYALSPVTNTNNRFEENELVSLGEVNDKLGLNNINAAISLVFPFRYLDKTFQSH